MKLMLLIMFVVLLFAFGTRHKNGGHCDLQSFVMR